VEFLFPLQAEAPKRYGPSLDVEKAFVAFVRGQSDEAGFETVPQPGFQYQSGYVEFWLRFMKAAELAKQF
jgi:hypothetical protein